MNLRRSIIGAVLAGASIVGVGGMASAAHAETPTATTTETDVGATAQPTRRFWIENLSSRTLFVADAWSAGNVKDPLLPDDSVPSGAQLRPGEHITVEVVSQWAGHQVAVLLRGGGGGRDVVVEMAVVANMRSSRALTTDFTVDAGTQNITIRDK